MTLFTREPAAPSRADGAAGAAQAVGGIFDAVE
jgi:hypothetical protein